jgi:hypothetical protein
MNVTPNCFHVELLMINGGTNWLDWIDTIVVMTFLTGSRARFVKIKIRNRNATRRTCPMYTQPYDARMRAWRWPKTPFPKQKCAFAMTKRQTCGAH